VSRQRVRQIAEGFVFAAIGMSFYASTQVYPWWIWVPALAPVVVCYVIDQREHRDRAERQARLEEQQRAEAKMRAP
jgi:uncharacterized membrane protein